MNARRSLALLALVALPLAACGGDDDDDAGSSTTPTADTGADTAATADATATTSAPASTAPDDLGAALDGRTFVSTAVDGYTLVDGSTVEITFDGANISAAGGCNRLASTWSVDGDVLTVPDMAMTQMACEPAALMDQDTWLSAVLTSSPTLTLDGDTLTIEADGTTLTMLDRTVANPDVALESTTWNVESIVSGEAVSSIPTGTAVPTLRFENGTLAVESSCNTGSGTYTVEGDNVTLGPIAMTRMACLETAATEAETALLAVLNGTVVTAIDADQLTITSGDKGLVLRAAPAAGATPAGLEGVAWSLDSTVDGGTTTAVPAGVRTPTVRLDAGTVTVDSGCNTGSGTYTVASDQITFGPIASTMMACDDASNAVEQAVLTVLTGTAGASITDGSLTLTNGTHGLHFVAG